MAGEHDGYTRLPDPVVHRRRVALSAEGTVTIADELSASGEHDVDLCFHAAEHCVVEQAAANVFTIRGRRAAATLVFDRALAVARTSAAATPPAGWVSRRYHRKSPSTTLIGTSRIRGSAAFVCTLEVKRLDG